MNRKQRRIAEAQKQNKHESVIQVGGNSYSIEQAHAVAINEYNRGNTQVALQIYDLLVARVPESPELHNNRAGMLQAMGRSTEAIASYDKAIALKPDYADAYNNRAITLHAIKRYSEALASYDKVIALNPNFASAYNSRGLTLHEMKQLSKALENYDRAIALKSDYAYAYNNRGLILHALKRSDEALDSYNKAVMLQPNYANAYNNRGLILFELRRYEEALINYEKAASLAPDMPYLGGNLLYTHLHLCKWSGVKNILTKLAKDIDANKLATSPFMILATPSPLAQQKKCAEIYVKNEFPASVTPLSKNTYSHDKIRLGYFSADFHNHATAYLMIDLFELHDRSRFEVIAFSYGPPSTHPMRARLEKAFDKFVDLNGASDQEIAQLAKQLEIDIAIDLKGFTTQAKTGIFALRPAPIQVSYIGYPGTMGASYIDYILADPTVIPEEHKPYYTEKIAYLPHSYQVNSIREASKKSFTRHECGLPENGFIFCCFNNNYKISPYIFDIWMRLLHKVPGSVLWLLEDTPVAAKNLHEEAKLRGISDDRLIFAPRMEFEDHLARHQLADLFLDTFYYNAHTTASDALWMGLPVLTRLGETFPSRVAASLLNAIGLPELITLSLTEYETLAFEYATNPQKLSNIRQKLISNKNTHPLFNAKAFAKHIEEAYIKMYKKNQAGTASDHIYVT